MHSSVAMIILLTTSVMVTSWHDCWFQVARSFQSGDHFLQADHSERIVRTHRARTTHLVGGEYTISSLVVIRIG
jgi:hypothetical protein